MTDAFEEQIIANVGMYGCHVNVVGASDEEPMFAYSVGLWKHGWPELIVFGLPGTLMTQMINILAERAAEGDARPADGQRINGLLDGYDCVARYVHPDRLDRDHFNSALWYARHEGMNDPIAACQVVWPDVEAGLFPWEAGCNPGAVYAQPALWRRSGLQ